LLSYRNMPTHHRYSSAKMLVGRRLHTDLLLDPVKLLPHTPDIDLININIK